jgi:hypothetical protein
MGRPSYLSIHTFQTCYRMIERGPQARAIGQSALAYSCWVVHRPPPGTVHTRANSPAYLKLCKSRWVFWTIARYRLGGHHLNGRVHSIPRGTACALCGFGSRFPPAWHTRMVARWGVDCAEDLRHFMVDCPAYDHIRDQFRDVFAYQQG